MQQEENLERQRFALEERDSAGTVKVQGLEIRRVVD